ncbi:MAG: TetR/AcrR family transcriptional regulator [Sedimentisphaerales bacterium]|nr:TetR/AcrR family transcriptional regulator [Sedimentisphaerales bacterium]
MTNESTQNTKTRSQKRSTKTRLQLEKAALDVFSEIGVDAATVDDITTRADLGKGTFYRYFKDKYEIATKLVDDITEQLISQLSSYDKTPKNLCQTLEYLLDAHYRFYLNNREGFILLFQGRVMAKLERESAAQMEEPYQKYLEEIAKLVSPHTSSPVDSVKIRRLACAVAGFVFGFFSFAIIAMEPNEIEVSMESLRRVFVQSLSGFLER